MKVLNLTKHFKKGLICNLLVFVFAILLSSDLLAQNTISGTVKSGEGLTLPGVSILKKGTTQGTVTNIDGAYTIDASVGEVLVFSMLGFVTQEIMVGSRSVIDVSLGVNVEVLGEVVVMGYTEKTRKQISASVVSLESKDLINVVAPNIESMLQGKVAGLTVNTASGQPGAAPDIRIRGITSINADRPPLLVVDGMIGGNYVPSDVSNITVLKDAAAIGLYGALGAAGVIIVTTKEATSSKAEFSISSTYTIKEITTGKFEMMNGEEIYDTQEKMWGDDVVGFLLNRPQGIRDQNFNWLDAGFQQASIQTHNFSVRGKAEKMTYNFNIDYYDEKGTFVNTDYQRLNLRAGTKYSPSDRFSINSAINVQYSKSKTHDYSWFQDAFYSLPWDNPYNDDGSLKFVKSSGFSGKWYSQERTNFLNSTAHNKRENIGLNINWSTRLKIKITDWLSLETRTRLSSYNSRFELYDSPKTHEGLREGANGRIATDQGSSYGVLSTHFLRFSKALGDHDFSAFLAHEGAYNISRSHGSDARNLAPDIKVPSGASIYANIYGNKNIGKSIAYIGELDYGYKDKYFATIVYRADGSSVFASDSRFSFFPSVSAGWLLSEESFLKSSSAIDMLKLRVSYGLVGNDGQGAGSSLPAFAYLPTYDITRKYDNNPGGSPDNPANTKLGWETSTITNLGVDLFFNNGLDVTIDAYNKEVSGMLFFNQLAFSNGYEARWENIGTMKNQGIEMAINYSKSFGNFKYSGNFNVSFNSNEITKVSPVKDKQILTLDEIQQINKVGLQAFTWNMPRWLGVDPANGAPVWEKIETDAEGNVTGTSKTSDYNQATFQPIASALPTYNGGLSNTIAYKNISLSVLLTFQGGNMIYHSTRERLDSDGANTGFNLMRLQDGWSRWEKPGDIATHPILTRGDTDGSHFTSSRYLEKGDYLRVRNISLSYSFPKSMLDAVRLRNASLTISADNPFTFTDFSGMDPDISMNTSDGFLPGTSFLKYPLSKQYSLRLNINF